MRTYELYLNDILKATERIQQYVDDVTSEGFKADDMRVDSVLFNLMTIGEAVKNIPDEIRAGFPEVRWRDIARFRDRIVHHYFGIDLDIVWEIVDIHLPVLKQHVEQLIANLPSDDNEE